MLTAEHPTCRSISTRCGRPDRRPARRIMVFRRVRLRRARSAQMVQFYAHEACGKCTPCREGTYWYGQIYDRLERGAATGGGYRICCSPSPKHAGQVVLRLGDAAASPVISSIQYFRHEYIAHYENHGCPFTRQRSCRLMSEPNSHVARSAVRPHPDVRRRAPSSHRVLGDTVQPPSGA